MLVLMTLQVVPAARGCAAGQLWTRRSTDPARSTGRLRR